MRYAYDVNDHSAMLCPDHVSLVAYVLLSADECEEAGKDGRYGTWARELVTGDVVDMDEPRYALRRAWTMVDLTNDRNAMHYGEGTDDRCAAADCQR